MSLSAMHAQILSAEMYCMHCIYPVLYTALFSIKNGIMDSLTVCTVVKAVDYTEVLFIDSVKRPYFDTLFSENSVFL